MNDEEHADQAVHELLIEREAQLETAKSIIQPLTVTVAVLSFALCFWYFDMSLLASVGIAVLAVPAMGFGVALPVGYVLGRSAGRRLKRKLKVRDRSPD